MVEFRGQGRCLFLGHPSTAIVLARNTSYVAPNNFVEFHYLWWEYLQHTIPGNLVNGGVMASFSYRFKHFVKKHERWFTFAGAFIVVMTFVVKEGLGDRWRGT